MTGASHFNQGKHGREKREQKRMEGRHSKVRAYSFFPSQMFFHSLSSSPAAGQSQKNFSRQTSYQGKMISRKRIEGAGFFCSVSGNMFKIQKK